MKTISIISQTYHLVVCVIFCIILENVGNAYSQQVLKDYAGHALLVSVHSFVPIFGDEEKNSIINYVMNDTIKEEYVLIAIHEIKGKMAEVDITSPLDNTFKEISGWIETKNLGIHVSCYDTDTVKVLQTPKLNSKVSFLIVKPQWKDFYIIYDAYQGWLYIQNINNEQEYGWLSVKYQCDNPYTTCN